MCGLVHKGIALLATGYLDQAINAHKDALLLAREISHPPSTSQALSSLAMMHAFRRDWSEALRYTDEAISLSISFGIPMWLSRCNIARGWAHVALGNEDEGFADIRRGMEMLEAGGSAMGAATCIVFHAEALRIVGSVDEALSMVEEALPIMKQGEERLWEANAHTLKGDLLLAQSDEQQPEAETCYQDGRRIARSQAAKSWELRAATRLARLWQSQGKTAEARDLLAPIYGWFTEGFDTADLKEANALLDVLS